jgi:D-proline reductase (dithiol) PrdB
VEIIEHIDRWRSRYDSWKSKQRKADDLSGYPFVENATAPFTSLRRSLPMLNLGLISSAGAYLDGTEAFDTALAGGDLSIREIPTDIQASDLQFAARGYDPTAVQYGPTAVQQDMNVQLPLDRLREMEANRVIGRLNPVLWSFCGFIPDAAVFVEQSVPKLIARLHHYDIQAALLIPASSLCHQSVGLAARAIEQAGIPTITLAVDRAVIERVRPPRAAYYVGEFGSVAGKPNYPQHQRRVLDEALRWLEPMGQPGMRKLGVELESQVEVARGER